MSLVWQFVMSDGNDRFDHLIEFAVQTLLTGTGDLRRSIYQMALGWPDATALELIAALTLATGSVEAIFGDAQHAARINQAWRMAAILGTDLYMMQFMGLPHHSARDFQTYWDHYDRFFAPDPAP